MNTYVLRNRTDDELYKEGGRVWYTDEFHIAVDKLKETRCRGIYEASLYKGKIITHQIG